MRKEHPASPVFPVGKRIWPNPKLDLYFEPIHCRNPAAGRPPGITGHQNMTRAEWIEMMLIVLIAPVNWLVWPRIPSPMPVWQIVLGLPALLLLQSLLRDIAILCRNRRPASNKPRREAQCFCLESTAGATGIVAGALFAWLGGSAQMAVSRWEYFLAVTGTLTLGFIIKDLVISWNPPGVRREKDHLNVIVRWKTRSK